MVQLGSGAEREIEDIVLSRYACYLVVQNAGVETPFDYAIFKNYGYKGLYGGLGQKEIHAKKGLKKSHKILDHMRSNEAAANLFRATQTDEKLRRENISTKSEV